MMALYPLLRVPRSPEPWGGGGRGFQEAQSLGLGAQGVLLTEISHLEKPSKEAPTDIPRGPSKLLELLTELVNWRPVGSNLHD